MTGIWQCYKSNAFSLSKCHDQFNMNFTEQPLHANNIIIDVQHFVVQIKKKIFSFCHHIMIATVLSLHVPPKSTNITFYIHVVKRVLR